MKGINILISDPEPFSECLAKKEKKSLPYHQALPIPKKKKSIYRYLRYRFLQVIRLEGTAYTLALPMAFAVGLAFLPTFGTGAVFAFIFAVIFRVSKMAGVLTAIAVTPLVPLFYGIDLVVAGYLVSFINRIEAVPYQSTEALNTMGMNGLFSFENITKLGSGIIWASILMFIIVFIITFIIFYYTVTAYKRSRIKKVKKKTEAFLSEKE